MLKNNTKKLPCQSLSQPSFELEISQTRVWSLTYWARFLMLCFNSLSLNILQLDKPFSSVSFYLSIYNNPIILICVDTLSLISVNVQFDCLNKQYIRIELQESCRQNNIQSHFHRENTHIIRLSFEHLHQFYTRVYHIMPELRLHKTACNAIHLSRFSGIAWVVGIHKCLSEQKGKGVRNEWVLSLANLAWEMNSSLT